MLACKNFDSFEKNLKSLSEPIEFKTQEKFPVDQDLHQCFMTNKNGAVIRQRLVWIKDQVVFVRGGNKTSPKTLQSTVQASLEDAHATLQPSVEIDKDQIEQNKSEKNSR